jgi:Cu(I)-responsive transcriptional regulator
MNIGQAARASGVSAKMIRYYESIGVVTPAHRTLAGYRRYEEADIHILRFIRQARQLGFGMDEIKDLLGLWRNPRRTSAQVKKLAQAHLAGLRTRIAELEAMAGTLQYLVDHCHGDHRPDCPILDGIDEGTSPPRPSHSGPKHSR